MNISSKTNICMVIGDPIEHSLSPQMHNAAYKALGIDNQFVFVASRVSNINLRKAIAGFKVLNFKGISVTIPHKIEIIQFLDQIDETAKKIGAVNTIVNYSGFLKGTNTDWFGITNPLEKRISIKNKKVAIIGAGGAARAVCFAISKKEGKLLIFNRTVNKAQDLAKEFNGTAFSLNANDEIKNADVIINTTPIGMHPYMNKTPVDKDLITKNHIIFDIIYTPFETRLLKEAKEKGARVIHGFEMLLEQGIAQFKLYTGKNAPEETMKKILLSNLRKE